MQQERLPRSLSAVLEEKAGWEVVRPKKNRTYSPVKLSPSGETISAVPAFLNPIACLTEKIYFRDNLFQVKCYGIKPPNQQFLDTLLGQQIPLSCKPDTVCVEPTYMEVINNIKNAETYVSNNYIEKPAYLYGGSVRDYIWNVAHPQGKQREVNDVDINYTADFYSIKETLETVYPNVFKEFMESSKYLVVGNHDKPKNPENTDDPEYLEGFSLTRRTYTPAELESRGNSLAVRVNGFNDYIVVDLFNGESVNDAINNIYHAPILNKDYDNDQLWQNWVSNSRNYKLLYRMLKFKMRGYTIDTKTAITILNYWGTIGATRNDGNLNWWRVWDSGKPKDATKIFGISGALGQIFNDINASPLSGQLNSTVTYQSIIDLMIGYKIFRADSTPENLIAINIDIEKDTYNKKAPKPEKQYATPPRGEASVIPKSSRLSPPSFAKDKQYIALERYKGTISNLLKQLNEKIAQLSKGQNISENQTYLRNTLLHLVHSIKSEKPSDVELTLRASPDFRNLSFKNNVLQGGKTRKYKKMHSKKQKKNIKKHKKTQKNTKKA
jgi:hypothetical protein